MGHFELGYLLLPAIVEENLALEAAAIREVIEGKWRHCIRRRSYRETSCV